MIAVLITCHNRKDTTLRCLDSLFGQTRLKSVAAQVYLVDDGSTDGTAAEIAEHFPQVRILNGDGTLYWNGGMRLAFIEAMKHGYDYYLMLNDDTVLFPHAMAVLLETHSSLEAMGKENAIIVGSTRDPEVGRTTYGGVSRTSRLRRLKFDLVEPADSMLECETLNMNCALIPASVVKRVGNLDPVFTHAMGDYDYGLRARQHGCSVWIAPGYLGTCGANPSEGTWRDAAGSLADRIGKVKSAKGLPVKEWQLFARRHAGPFWIVYWLSPYLKLLVSVLFHRRSDNVDERRRV